MQVWHRFTAVGAVIEYEAEAIIRQAQFPGDNGGFQEQMAEQGLVFQRRFGDARDGFLRDQEDVGWRLRGDVVEADDQVVLIDNPGRDFTRDDFFEKGLAHNCIFREAHHRARSKAVALLLDQ